MLKQGNLYFYKSKKICIQKLIVDLLTATGHSYTFLIIISINYIY